MSIDCFIYIGCKRHKVTEILKDGKKILVHMGNLLDAVSSFENKDESVYSLTTEPAPL